MIQDQVNSVQSQLHWEAPIFFAGNGFKFQGAAVDKIVGLEIITVMMIISSGHLTYPWKMPIYRWFRIHDDLPIGDGDFPELR